MIAAKVTRLLWSSGLPLFLAMSAVAAENAPAARLVTVITSEYRFTPNHLTLKQGQAYRLHLENHGKETHEFTAPTFFASVKLENPDVLNADKTEIVVQPAETKDLSFVPQKPGHYGFRCADHDWAGMTGDITVK